MKDLNRLVAECEADLRSIGIRHGTVVEWSVNTRAKKRWGQCKSVGSGMYKINISEQLLQDNVSDQAAKNTIMHELLHSVKGSMNHKGVWAANAAKVNRLLPQYTIKRTTSSEEKGIEEEERKAVARYIIRCRHCGSEYTREKFCRVVQYPEKYRCGECGYAALFLVK